MRRSTIRRWITLLLIGTAVYVFYRVGTVGQLFHSEMDIRDREELRLRLQKQLHSGNRSNVVPIGQACRHPDLDVDDPVMRKFFGQASPIGCDEEPDWVCLEPGKVKVCKHAIEKHKGASCKYTFIKRKSDFENEDGTTVEGGETPITLQTDYFRVKCTGGDETTWQNIMPGIRYEPSISTRAGTKFLPNDAVGLNVLIWGHDSLSRMTFMRTLPKTYKYLTEVLRAIVLKGYNIVGDGTPQALIPILTGKTELELPETRKRMDKANFVNIYPFIWKDFQDHGYVTAYAEDCPNIGTFTYRLKGFDDPPTDHYLRPFYIASLQEINNHKKFCLRGTPRHKVLMNWLHQFINMYPDKPKFSFTFHSEMSHDNLDQISAIDDDLQEFIHQLHIKGQLNNTVLVIMSDHGHRFAQIRETQQGKQEERMPMFSFVFPPWFEKKYPIAMTNFRQNAERLTTPFDIYPTLYNILHFEGPGMGNVKERGISLFKEKILEFNPEITDTPRLMMELFSDKPAIPIGRTCADADIEPHWCACLDWEPVDVKDGIVKKAALALVKYINSLTENDREICEVLTLDKIVWAGRFLPNKGLLQFLKNADYDGFVADLSDRTSVSIEMYQVKIHTQPGEGHFEASLKYSRDDGSFLVKTSDISRVNKYGKQAECIENTQHQLRKFCYCKSLV